MSKPKVSLVVGNGFSMSFGHYSQLAKIWDSQKPLSWDIKCPSKGHHFLDSLPSLKKIKDNFPLSDDFDVFEKILDSKLCDELGIDSEGTTLEARHFLTIAFSEYANAQRNKLTKNKDWSWFKWILLHRENIKCAFSLNYDFLLESVFDELGKEYFSFQGNHHGYGIPLVKPHGSVDFETTNLMDGKNLHYPLGGIHIDMNDFPIERLHPDNLIYRRLQPLCIIPKEANKY